MPQGAEPPNIEPEVAAVVDETLGITAADIAAANTIRPNPITIDGSAPSGAATGITSESIKEARKDVPSSLNVGELTGTQRAGLELAKIVLALIGAAMLGLVLSLIWIEYTNFAPYSNITDNVIKYIMIGNQANTSLSTRRAAIAAIFRATHDQVGATIPDADLMLVREFVRDLRDSGRLNPDKIATLETCITQLRPPPTGASPITLSDHQAATDACLNALDSLDVSAIAQGLDLERLRVMREVAKDALDARQTVRSFWLQILQLVLLNLLLPTLAALLGYIFGSQQGQRSG
jgi:hypothetical protein